MKRFIHLSLFSLCLLFVATLFYLPLSSQSRFEQYCNRFFQEELQADSLTLHYVLTEPDDYGIYQETITLGNYDPEVSGKKKELYQKLLQLQTIAKNSLSENSQFTLDLLKYSLQTELDGVDFNLLEEPLVPSIGIQSQLPILLAEYSFYNEADVKNYIQLLSCIPDYFESLIRFEKKKCENGLFMDCESADELITYCQEFISEKESHFLSETFKERLDALPLTSQDRSQYIRDNAQALEDSVFPAYRKLESFLTEHRYDGTNENGLCYYPDGTDYYQWLIRSTIGTDRSFEEIEALLDDALQNDASIIAALIKEEPKLLEERRSLTLNNSNPSALTSYLSKRAEHDFPQIPEVSVEIRSVPTSMEDHLSPAFYLVPPLDRYGENIVYLNQGYLKEGISFFTTLAHESYPGHLYQTVFENTLQRHPIHRLLYFGGYTEGWATYTEQLSFSYAPLSQNMASLLSSTRAMTLNLYSHLDLYVHAYGWTEEQCSEYLKKFGITTASSIHNMFLLVKQQPANYLKYYLGYLEICELKNTAQELWGEYFTLKNFHEFVLTYGPAPFSLMKQYLENFS